MQAPSAFAIESFTHRSATLTWVDAAGAAFYRIYMGTANDFSTASLFTTILQGVQRVIVSPLAASTPFWFWIVAENAAGEMSVETAATCITADDPGDDANIVNLKLAIYNWATDNFGDYAVIWEKTSGPRPAKPYVSLNIMSSNPFGGDDHVRDNGRQVCGNRVMMISVNVYTNGEPWQQTMDLRASLQRTEVIDFFQENGAGIADIGPVTDLSQLLDETVWEFRAHFDFGLIVSSTKDFEAGQISDVAYETQIGR